jgi:alpha-glucoside transport system permease protein
MPPQPSRDTTAFGFVTHGGVEFELATREIAGPVVPGRPPSKALRYLVTLPATLLLAGFLIAPITWTLIEIVRSPGSLTVLDLDALATYLRTAFWVFVVGGGIVGGGFLLARASIRHWPRKWPAVLTLLVIPFGVSALVAGVAFRLLFDPAPELGTMTALTRQLGFEPNWLGSAWVSVVLISAFAWMWLGFAVSLFRAALDAANRDPVLRVRLGDTKRFARMAKELRAIKPVFFIVTVAIVVAGARLFDLVLIAVPGSMQYDVDMVGVQWWRLTTVSPDRSGPAAFVLPLTIILIVFALMIARLVKRTARDGPVRATLPPAASPLRTRPLGRLAAFGLSALLVLPLLILVATAFHGVQDAGTVPWWEFPSGSDVALEAFRQVGTAGLWRSVGVTAFVALSSTLVVVGAAIPVAYVLAERSWPQTAAVRRWPNRVVVILTVLAVMPVQMYALALRDATSALGLGGSRIPLIFIHAAAGLPFAILVLTAAIAATPPVRAADAMAGLIAPRVAARRAWDRAGKAFVAVAVLEFVWVWNDFVITFLIGGPGTSPLTLVLWGEARQFSVASGTVAASAVVSAALPVAMLLATWRRFIVPGLTGGVLR